MKVIATILFAGALAGCGAMANQQMEMAGGSMSHRGAMMQGGSMMRGGMCGMASSGGMGGMQGMCPMAGGMQAMDANKDGMVSKEEYLAAHGALFDSMKKNERGQVASAGMGMCPMMSGARR